MTVTPPLDTCNVSDYLSDICFGSDDSNHIPKDYHVTLIRALQGNKNEQVFFVLDLDVIIINIKDYMLAPRTAYTLERMKKMWMEVFAYGKKKTFPNSKDLFFCYQQANSIAEKEKLFKKLYHKYQWNQRHVIFLGAEELVYKFIDKGGNNDCFLPVDMKGEEQSNSDEVMTVVDEALCLVLIHCSISYVPIL